MRKKITALCIVFAVIFFNVSASYAATLANMNINGQQKTVLLEKGENGEHMIPFVTVADLLGYQTYYDSAKNFEGVYNGNSYVYFSVGNKLYIANSSIVNNSANYFTTAPQNIDGLIYVPAEEILTDIFGYKCSFTNYQPVVDTTHDGQSIYDNYTNSTKSLYDKMQNDIDYYNNLANDLRHKTTNTDSQDNTATITNKDKKTNSDKYIELTFKVNKDKLKYGNNLPDSVILGYRLEYGDDITNAVLNDN